MNQRQGFWASGKDPRLAIVDSYSLLLMLIYDAQSHILSYVYHIYLHIPNGWLYPRLPQGLYMNIGSKKQTQWRWIAFSVPQTKCDRSTLKCRHQWIDNNSIFFPMTHTEEQGDPKFLSIVLYHILKFTYFTLAVSKDGEKPTNSQHGLTTKPWNSFRDFYGFLIKWGSPRNHPFPSDVPL